MFYLCENSWANSRRMIFLAIFWKFELNWVLISILCCDRIFNLWIDFVKNHAKFHRKSKIWITTLIILNQNLWNLASLYTGSIHRPKILLQIEIVFNWYSIYISKKITGLLYGTHSTPFQNSYVSRPYSYYKSRKTQFIYFKICLFRFNTSQDTRFAQMGIWWTWKNLPY